MPTTLDAGATLTDLLSRRARETPLSRLTLDIAGGIAIALAALWARPAGFGVLLSAAICFLAYGVWAIAERRLRELPSLVAERTERIERIERVWRACHATAAAVGLAAFVVLLLALLGVALGPIIS